MCYVYYVLCILCVIYNKYKIFLIGVNSIYVNNNNNSLYTLNE